MSPSSPHNPSDTSALASSPTVLPMPNDHNNYMDLCDDAYGTLTALANGSNNGRNNDSHNRMECDHLSPDEKESNNSEECDLVTQDEEEFDFFDFDFMTDEKSSNNLFLNSTRIKVRAMPSEDDDTVSDNWNQPDRIKLMQRSMNDKELHRGILESMALSICSNSLPKCQPPPKGTKISVGFRWDTFPPFVKLLRDHMQEYFAFSIEASKSRPHHEFIKNLVLKVQKTATDNGWKVDIAFAALRNRVVQFFQNYIVRAKYRMKAITTNLDKDKTDHIGFVMEKTKGGVPIPEMLYEMLTNESDDSPNGIVCWMPDGRAFKVRNPERFTSEILPEYFPKQKKFVSFKRMLTTYGFRTDNGVFYHKLFVRGRRELCMTMKLQRMENICEACKKEGATCRCVLCLDARTFQVFYCNKECQLKHWQTHKAVCGGTGTCAACKKEGATSRCGGCRKFGVRIFYCNQECQLKHWETHRAVCYSRACATNA